MSFKIWKVSETTTNQKGQKTTKTIKTEDENLVRQILLAQPKSKEENKTTYNKTTRKKTPVKSLSTVKVLSSPKKKKK